jgi:hypothetical protein
MSSWGDFDTLIAAPGSGDPSFIERAQRAPDDDDDLDRILGESDGRVRQRGHKGDAETPLQQLIRHWMNERHAPDILPAQEELLSSLLDHIRRQVRPSLPGRFFLFFFCLCSFHNTVRDRPVTQGGPQLIRRRTHSDHPSPDRGRARQVRRAVIHPNAIIQGEIFTAEEK